MKTTNPLQGLFTKSPFKAIQVHMRKVAECADQMPLLVDALIQGQADQVGAVAVRMQGLAKEADGIENELFAHLPKSLFMPVDRRDLLEILNQNDEVADACVRLANMVQVRTVPVPIGVPDGLKSAMKHCLNVVQQSKKIVEQMDELVETGFSGRDATLVLQLLVELGTAKEEADRQAASLSRLLFDNEQTMTPLAVVFWFRLVDQMGEIAHAAEKAGGCIRLLLAR